MAGRQWRGIRSVAQRRRRVGIVYQTIEGQVPLDQAERVGSRPHVVHVIMAAPFYGQTARLKRTLDVERIRMGIRSPHGHSVIDAARRIQEVAARRCIVNCSSSQASDHIAIDHDVGIR